MSFDLVGMDWREKQRNMKFTVLHREGGTWDNAEVRDLTVGLQAEIQSLPAKPEHLMLMFEHYPEVKIAQLLRNAIPCNVKHVVGIDNPELPWRPSLM